MASPATSIQRNVWISFYSAAGEQPEAESPPTYAPWIVPLALRLVQVSVPMLPPTLAARRIGDYVAPASDPIHRAGQHVKHIIVGGNPASPINLGSVPIVPENVSNRTMFPGHCFQNSVVGSFRLLPSGQSLRAMVRETSVFPAPRPPRYISAHRAPGPSITLLRRLDTLTSASSPGTPIDLRANARDSHAEEPTAERPIRSIQSSPP